MYQAIGNQKGHRITKKQGKKVLTKISCGCSAAAAIEKTL